MGRRRRRHNQLPNDLEERRRYRKLKKHKVYVARCGIIALERLWNCGKDKKRENFDYYYYYYICTTDDIL